MIFERLNAWMATILYTAMFIVFALSYFMMILSLTGGINAPIQNPDEPVSHILMWGYVIGLSYGLRYSFSSINRCYKYTQEGYTYA